MHVPQLHRRELDCQSALFRLLEAVRNTQIIRLHAEQPGNERAVRPMAVAGKRKAAVKGDVRMRRLFPQKLPRGKSDTHGARRMTAGWPHHNRAENVK